MCKGKKACKTCARKKGRISGRKKSSTMKRSGLMGAAKDVALVLAGGLVASQLDRIPLFTANPLIGGAAKFAIGAMIVPKFMKGPTGAAIGLGIAVSGGRQIVNNVSPGMISGYGNGTLGYLAAEGSTSVSAVAGPSIVLE